MAGILFGPNPGIDFEKMVLKRHYDFGGILSKIVWLVSERWIPAQNRPIDNGRLKMTPPNPVAKDITKILQRSDLGV